MKKIFPIILFFYISCKPIEPIEFQEIKNVKIKRKVSTTISANIFYEIVRKCSVGSKIDLNLISENKLELISEWWWNSDGLFNNMFELLKEYIKENNKLRDYFFHNDSYVHEKI